MIMSAQDARGPEDYGPEDHDFHASAAALATTSSRGM
jgi:hypothetical protein